MLKPKGRDLYVVLGALRQWSQKWIPGDDEQPILAHRRCGDRVAIGAVCATCHEPVEDPRELAIVQTPA